MRIPLPPAAVLEALGIKPIPLFMLSAWIKAGQVTVDGATARPRDAVHGGEARVLPLQLARVLPLLDLHRGPLGLCPV